MEQPETRTPEEQKFDAKIDKILRGLIKDTGAMPVIALRYPDGGFMIYSMVEDPPAFIAELYDSIFPSLIDEVNTIRDMGTETLRLSYTPEVIGELITECNELQDEKLRSKLQDILLEALEKLSVTAPRRKKK